MGMTVEEVILQVAGREELANLNAEVKKAEDLLALLMAHQGQHAPIVQAEAAALAVLVERQAELSRVLKAGVQTASQAVVEAYELADAYEMVEQETRQVAVAMKAIPRPDWLGALNIDLRNTTAVAGGAAGMTRALGASAAGAAGTTRSFGQSVQFASYAVQDFTSAGGDMVRGLYSIQNNIPQIAMALGAGAGLAGTVSLVSLGVGALIQNWSSIEKLWAGDGPEKAAAKMKALADATKQAADETARLKKFQGGETDERKSTVEAAIKLVGYDKAVRDVKEAMLREGQSFGAEADQAIAEGLVRNATQGHKGALAKIEEMFRGTTSGATSALGRAIEDPGDKARMAAAERVLQMEREITKEGDERRKKRTKDEEEFAQLAKRNADARASEARRQAEAVAEQRRRARDGADPLGGGIVGPNGGRFGPGLGPGPGAFMPAGLDFGGGMPGMAFQMPEGPIPLVQQGITGKGGRRLGAKARAARLKAQRDAKAQARIRRTLREADRKARAGRPRPMISDPNNPDPNGGGLIPVGDGLGPDVGPPGMLNAPRGMRGAGPNAQAEALNRNEQAARRAAEQLARANAELAQGQMRRDAMMRAVAEAAARQAAALEANFRQQWGGNFGNGNPVW